MEETNEPQEAESGKGGNYWTIGIIALVVIIGVVWYAGSRKKSGTAPVNPSQNAQQPSTPSANETQKQAAATIEFTDSGFSPQSVTIKAGETVTFKNNSSSQLQVASAPHPTHTDRPELNAPGPMGLGQTFSTAISEKGTWKYHDHLNPSLFGSITVQ